MRGTPTGGLGTTGVISGLEFQCDLFNRAMADRGHKTLAARALACGMSRMTLIRWAKGPLYQTPLGAHRAAAVSGLTVDQLFVAKTALAA